MSRPLSLLLVVFVVAMAAGSVLLLRNGDLRSLIAVQQAAPPADTDANGDSAGAPPIATVDAQATAAPEQQAGAARAAKDLPPPEAGSPEAALLPPSQGSPDAASNAASATPTQEAPAAVAAQPSSTAPAQPPAIASLPEGPVANTVAAPPTETVPAFDIVRVDEDGAALVAGRAAPGAEVEILSNGEILAHATADADGAFVALPDAPLAPGEHRLTLRTPGAPAEALAPEQQVAVVVPEAASGAVSSVPAAERPSASAEATPVPSPPAVEQEVAAAAAEEHERQVAVVVPETASGDASSAPAGERPSASTTATPTPSAPAAEQEVAAVEPDVPAAASPSAAPEAPPSDSAPVGPAAIGADGAWSGSASAAVQENPAEMPQPQASPVQSAEVSPPVPPSLGPVPPTTDGTPNAGEPAIATERAVAALSDPAAEAGESAERSAIPGPDTTGEPAAPGVATAEEARTGENAAGPQSAATANAGAPLSSSDLAVQAVETEGDNVYVAGAAEPNALVRVYLEDEFVGEVRAGAGGHWLVEAETEIPVGGVTIRADQVEQGSETLTASAEAPFIRNIEAEALVPAAAASAGGGVIATQSGLVGPEAVIIRRGDSLWRISRRNYGKGVRYDTIFSANRDQIRNPHRIYPGQVFVIPKGDRNWPEAGEPPQSP